ncbi:DMT family transporter [Pelobacter seleniigenes]|uniref:DMT family transporter n=1 Tax=Pelobacter seleniigenes TaxID=407188 RepID=UPI000A685FF3|nr:EamA family transporter [Pelobacter seleniigenes]
MRRHTEMKLVGRDGMNVAFGNRFCGSAGGPWLVLAAAMLWGTTGTAQALAPPASTPVAIAALRMSVAGLALLSGSLWRGGIQLRSWPVRITLSAGLFIALYQLSSFWAMNATGVAVGTIVAMGSAPVFAGLLEYLLWRRTPERRWYLSTALAFSGCLLLVLDSGNLQVEAVGVLVALVAGFSYAFYTLLMGLLVRRQAPADATAAVTCLGAIFLLPLLWQCDLQWLIQPNGWLVILHLGLIATALSYWLFAKGLAGVKTSTAVTLTLAEPLVATLLGILVVGERMTMLVSCGLVLIFAALALLLFPATKRSAGQ